MAEQLSDSAIDKLHEEQFAKIRQDVNNINLIRSAGLTDTPKDSKVEASVEPQKEMPVKPIPLPKKVVNPNVGPLFISLKKFNEIKSQITLLKQQSAELRQVVAQLKTSRDSGRELLKKAVYQVEVVEKSIEDINSIIKI